MFENVDIYSPCFCGSGKKFKFCCMKHIVELSTEKIVDISSDDDRQAEIEQNKGCDDTDRRDFLSAIEHFKKSMTLNPNNPSACNNYVICLMYMDEYEQCLPILQKHLAKCPLPNPFGIATLSELYFLFGQEEMARTTIDIAKSIPFQTEYSVNKICEALAYLKKHREIIEFIDSTDIGKEGGEQLYFYGVAEANLGHVGRAIGILSRIQNGSKTSAQASATLKLLKSGKGSNDVYGEWNYFLPGNYLINRFKDLKAESVEKYKDCLWIVDLGRLLLDMHPEDEKSLMFLEASDHPEAKRLLEAVLKWPRASDKVRKKAVSILRSKWGWTHDEAERTVNEDRPKEGLLLEEVSIDPEYQYFPPLPEEDDEEFASIVEQTHDPDCDPQEIVWKYKRLLQKHPNYIPARYNLANTLFYIGKEREGESIMREIMAMHPDYLFPQAGLIQFLVSQWRLDEAEKIILNTRLPKKTNNGALAAYWGACVNFYCHKNEIKIARQYLDMIKNVAPASYEYEVASGIYDVAQTVSRLLSKKDKR